MTERTIRREDARLLTGSGRYTADWNLPGQLYAFFLRSDRAHAETVSIETRAAAARPGVHAVLTGDDYAASGWKSLPGGVAYEGAGGPQLHEDIPDNLAFEYETGDRAAVAATCARAALRTRLTLRSQRLVGN